MTGLNIDGSVGLGERLQEELHNVWDTFDDSELKLTQLGFPPVNKPGSARPHIEPGTLNRLNGAQLTEIFEQVGAWQDYATNLLSRFRGYLQQIDNEKKVLTARLRQGAIQAAMQSGEKKPPEKEIEQNVLLDPRYQELMQEEQKVEQQRFQMEGHVDSLNRQLKLVSRQVEIRRQELEASSGGRGYSAPGKM